MSTIRVKLHRCTIDEVPWESLAVLPRGRPRIEIRDVSRNDEVLTLRFSLRDCSEGEWATAWIQLQPCSGNKVLALVYRRECSGDAVNNPSDAPSGWVAELRQPNGAILRREFTVLEFVVEGRTRVTIEALGNSDNGPSILSILVGAIGDGDFPADYGERMEIRLMAGNAFDLVAIEEP